MNLPCLNNNLRTHTIFIATATHKLNNSHNWLWEKEILSAQLLTFIGNVTLSAGQLFATLTSLTCQALVITCVKTTATEYCLHISVAFLKPAILHKKFEQLNWAIVHVCYLFDHEVFFKMAVL